MPEKYETPIERLRNHLSPYMNLVSMMEHGGMDELIKKELAQCVANAPFIYQYLKELDEVCDKNKQLTVTNT